MEYKLRGRRVFVTKSNGYAYRAYVTDDNERGVVLRNVVMIERGDVEMLDAEDEMWTVEGTALRSMVFLPWHRVEDVHISD